MSETPTYIKSLVTPNGKKPAGRRVWSLDLELVWLPFFSATNLQGDTSIPMDALGAPLRLAYGQDGAVKFSKSGRPVIRVAKPIAEGVKLVRDNFAANIVAYANQVAENDPKGFEALQRNALKAGKPINTSDRENLKKAIAIAQEKAMAEATAEAPAEVQKDRELVTA